MSLWIPYFGVTILMVLFSLNIPDIWWYEKNGRKVRGWRSYRNAFLVVTFILIIFCAFRSINASSIDEYAYRNRFFRYQGYDFATALEKANGEYLNSVLTWFVSRVFHSSQGIFIVYGSLTALLYMMSLKKYSGNFSFAVALLMCTGIINTSFNITQQCLACAMIVFFSNYIYERKLCKFLLVVLCCYSIHSSAIILLLLYLCGDDRNRAARIKPYLLLVSFVIVYFYSNLFVLVDRFPMLEQYIERAGNLSGVSTNWMTILVNCVPAIFALVTESKFSGDDKITILSGNACLLHAAIYMVAILDNYIARLAVYTAPFCVIFLSRTLKIFKKGSQKIFIFIVVMLYSIEIYLRMRGSIYMFNFAF